MLISPVPTEKQCTKCSKIRPSEEFPPNPKGKFGVQAVCRECYCILSWEY